MTKSALIKLTGMIGTLTLSSTSFAAPTNNQVLVQAFLKRGSTVIDCGSGNVTINNLRLRVGGALVGTAASAVTTNVRNGVFSYVLTVPPSAHAAGTGAVDALVDITYPASGCTPATIHSANESFTTNVYSVPLALYAGHAAAVNNTTSTTGLDNSTVNTLMFVPSAATDLPSFFRIPSLGTASANVNLSSGTFTNTLTSNNTTATAVSITATGAGGGVNIESNSGGVNINGGTSTGSVSIGASSGAQTINLGTGAAAKTVVIGSTTGASSTTINAGTGGISIGGGTAAMSIGLGTGGTGAKTVTIGNDTVATSATVIAGGATGGIKIGGTTATALTRPIITCNDMAASNAATTTVPCAGLTTNHRCACEMTVANTTAATNIRLATVPTAGNLMITWNGTPGGTVGRTSCICW